MAETVGTYEITPFTAPVPGGPQSADVVRTNDNDIVDAFNAHDADAGIHVQSGSGLPASGNEGDKFLVKAERMLYVRVSGQWLQVAGKPFNLVNGVPVAYPIAGASGTVAIDWRNGPIQEIELAGTITGFTYANANERSEYTLIFKQDGVGGRTISSLTNWNFGVGSFALAGGAGQRTIIRGYWDGTNYLGLAQFRQA